VKAWIVQNLPPLDGRLRPRVPRAVAGGQFGLLGEERDQLRRGAEQQICLGLDVVVIEADDREPDGLAAGAHAL
jgi:hypothetical protein